jgi:hypothetical protein
MKASQFGNRSLTPFSAEGDRPVKMVWDLAHPMPAELYETARTV